MNVRKIDDRVVLGLVSGTIGNIAKDLSNYVLYKLGVTSRLYGHLAAGLLTEQRHVKKPTGFAIGQLADFAIGAGLGVPIVYALALTGKDYASLKGAAIGSGAWVAGFGFLGARSAGDKAVFPLDPKPMLAAVWHHALYGAVTAYAATKLGRPGLFEGACTPADMTSPTLGEQA